MIPKRTLTIRFALKLCFLSIVIAFIGYLVATSEPSANRIFRSGDRYYIEPSKLGGLERSAQTGSSGAALQLYLYFRYYKGDSKQAEVFVEFMSESDKQKYTPKSKARE
jgi:hypothetical protein